MHGKLLLASHAFVKVEKVSRKKKKKGGKREREITRIEEEKTGR